MADRLYLNADRTKVVAEGDPSAAYLLLGEADDVDYIPADLGDDIRKQVAKLRGTKATAKAEDKAAPQAEDKAVKGPPENK